MRKFFGDILILPITMKKMKKKLPLLPTLIRTIQYAESKGIVVIAQYHNVYTGYIPPGSSSEKS